jgi:citrate lyase subunit beta/citryl-CoA lyase
VQERGERKRPEVAWDEQPLRALLFAPASEERKASKVGRLGADVAVLDLEDAVALEEKARAREAVSALVERYADPSVLAVRVNDVASGLIDADLDAAVCPNLDLVLVPKVEDPAALDRVDARLGELERERGLRTGSVRLIALVETTAGLVRCEAIAAAAAPRLLTLIFGVVDFALDLGIDLEADTRSQLLYPRARLAVAARAAGLAAPVDGPYMRLADMEGCARQARASRALGFQGQVTVYPPQVEHVQRAYSAFTPEQVEHARRVVRAFEEAQADGVAAVRVDEHFVDYPVYNRCRRVLRLAEREDSA